MLSKIDPHKEPVEQRRKTAFLVGEAGPVISEVASTLVRAGYCTIFCSAFKDRLDVIGGDHEVTCFHADVTLKADRHRLCAFLEETAPVLDVVIDCLGYPRSSRANLAGDATIFEIAKCECERWINGIETVLPRLADGAHVVSILKSVARYRSGYFRSGHLTESSAPVALVHGAVLAATRQLALEYAGRGLRFNAVVAGLLDHDEDWLELDKTERRYVLEQISAGRPGTASEVASTALFLASSESNYLTGEAVDVNGGWWMS